MPYDIPYSCPFGKHQGEDIEDVPTEYLEWVIVNIDGDWQAAIDFVNEAEWELDRRNDDPAYI